MKDIKLKVLICSITSALLFSLASCTTYESRPETYYPKTSKAETVPAGSKYVIASWYGADFNGRPTASGEIFDMHKKTCAHKEYPFGTKLMVTNTLNDKSVECTVNDRGPFIPGRDLDLSYFCAKEIGLISTGTAKVRIDYLDRDTRYVKYIKYSSSGDKVPVTIQVGSFKDESNASRLKTALEFKYSGVHVTEAEIKGVTYYRVRIGKFKNKDEARDFAKKLADEGYDVLVIGYSEQV
jgi:rare lipoprotein A